MRNIFQFIVKYHFFILFLILETFSFYLIVNYNEPHKTHYLNSSSKISATIFELTSSLTDYVSLKRANVELSRENALLRSQLLNVDATKTISTSESGLNLDTVYYAIPAKVINNSVNKLHNFITINKGYNDGIEPDMGVMSARGLVGITRNVSKNYSTVTSLLNTQLKVSAKLRDSNYFGSLSWQGQSVKVATLSEIPSHAAIEIGDAVVTSGFSSIFPEGILIGTIESYKINRGEGFYDIKVRLSVDFSNLTYVESIANYRKKEQLQIEKQTRDD